MTARFCTTLLVELLPSAVEKVWLTYHINQPPLEFHQQAGLLVLRAGWLHDRSDHVACSLLDQRFHLWRFLILDLSLFLSRAFLAFVS